MGYATLTAIHGPRAILKVIWRQHGLWAPVVIARQAGRYLAARYLKGSRTFMLGGRTFAYCTDIHNQAFGNERTVEVPIALRSYPLEGDILEIGNVLSQYADFPHAVVDKYEQDEGVLNVDVVDYAPDRSFDLILSVSTFEHIGFDEETKDPDKVVAAVEKAKSLLKPGGRLVITVPIGWNPGLDARLSDLGFTSIHHMRRVSAANEWEETDAPTALSCAYGSRYPAANAVSFCLFAQPA